MGIRIRPFAAADQEAWDRFVRAQPLGSPFHLVAWKRSIEDTFGFGARYLLAEQDGAVAGVLPLFYVRNPLLGRVLLSSPFAVYGGVLALSDDVKRVFREHLERWGRELGVDYIELRNAWPEQQLGFAPVTRYVTFTQDLAADPPSILEAIPRKTRRMVRRALEHPFSARRTRTVDAFESLYLANLRKLGTPAFPHRHFINLLRHFGDEAEIREILIEDKVVAAVFSFHFRDQVLPYYGAADSDFQELNPSNFMYYDQMCWAAANGFRIFDFGRSKKDSGSYAFKAHWGMAERELPYEMLLVRRKHLPDFSPRNPRFQWAIRMWRKVPLPLTKAIGPWLIRLFP